MPLMLASHSGDFAYLGPIRWYSIFMFLSILLALVLSWWQLYRRKIPTSTLELSVFIVIPAGLLGARLWDIAYRPESVHNFVDAIAIWRGGLAVQGAIIGGGIGAYFWFRHCSKKYEISIWVFFDCIVPNILLAQALGRWGNFFNGEILGEQVPESSLSWLIPSIRDHLHYSGESSGVYRQPLFLYESFCNIAGWLFLVFIVPHLGQWCSKKPWTLHADVYKPRWEKTKAEVAKATTGQWYMQAIKPALLGLEYYRWRKQAWNESFYHYKPKVVNETINTYRPVPPLPAGSDWWLQAIQWAKNCCLRVKAKFTQNAAPLLKSYNPEGYKVTAVGVRAVGYFVWYGFVRIILDIFKDNSGGGDPYAGGGMVVNGVDLALVASILYIVIGYTAMLLLQFYVPSKWRQKGWLYERQY